MRLIPAPRGTGIVSAPVPKKLLQMAGIEDCYTSARGQTATLGNFGKDYSQGFHKKANNCIFYTKNTKLDAKVEMLCIPAMQKILEARIKNSLYAELEVVFSNAVAIVKYGKLLF